MEWSNVRQLTWCRVLDEEGDGVNHTFVYGADGIRCQKNNIHYTCDGERILIEHNVDTGRSITYLYGEKGVVGFSYRGSDYYYRKNLFGDVVAIYNTDGQKVASYEYDAWGKNLSCEDEETNEIKRINPIRYRSYYYDVETKFYYLNSRYYDPEIGRFLNADSSDYLGEGNALNNYNLFAYCENNPVMYSDPTGHAIETIFDVISLAFSAIEVCVNPTDLSAWASLLGDTVDLVPFVTGVGETIRTLRGIDRVADGADAAIDTYKNLRRINKGNGLEVHHILEKRIAKNIDEAFIKTGTKKSLNNIYSIALSKADHRVFTNKWRDALAYGSKKLNLDIILKRGVSVYKDRPDLFGAMIESMLQFID